MLAVLLKGGRREGGGERGGEKGGDGYGGRTNCDGGDLCHFPYIFVGLHDAFYARDGEFGLDFYAFCYAGCGARAIVRLFRFCLLRSRGRGFDGRVGEVFAIVVVVVIVLGFVLDVLW